MRYLGEVADRALFVPRGYVPPPLADGSVPEHVSVGEDERAYACPACKGAWLYEAEDSVPMFSTCPADGCRTAAQGGPRGVAPPRLKSVIPHIRVPGGSPPVPRIPQIWEGWWI